MACPDCGSTAGDLRFATSVETHGLDCGPYERFNEEFIVCGGCGGRFDVCDWDCTPELQFEVDVAQDPIKTTSIPAESAPGQLIQRRPMETAGPTVRADSSWPRIATTRWRSGRELF